MTVDDENRLPASRPGFELRRSPAYLPVGTRLRLRHIQVFLAAARLGRLRGAADALAITQPAVTKTLNELEDILGVTLFERSRKGVRMTPAAHAFLHHATAGVEALGRGLESVREAPGMAPLRVGALPTVASGLLAPALGLFQQDHPDVPVSVTTGSNSQLLDELRQHELDVAVARLSDPQEMPGLSFEYLYAEALAVVVRQDHPLAGRAHLLPAMLTEYPLIAPPGGTLIRHGAESFLLANGAGRPMIAIESLSVSLSRSIVLGGDAVWFTAPSAVAADVASGGLVRLPVDTSGTEEPIGLLLRTDSTPSPTLQTLLAALRHFAGLRRAQSE